MTTREILNSSCLIARGCKMSDVSELLRQWIADVLKAHAGVMAIALPQRAKFEGWLRFELAAHAALMGATSVTVEAPLPGGRSDLLFEGHGSPLRH